MSEPLTSVLVVLLVALVATVLTVLRRGRPGPKRRHLFETEDGARANPLADLSAGTEASGTGCRTCGRELESDSFRYCGTCDGPAPADD